jgi:membrane-associated phospholipid phosphatase
MSFNLVNFVVILQIKFTVIHSKHYKLKYKTIIAVFFSILLIGNQAISQIDTVSKPLVETLIVPITLVTTGLIAQGPISREVRREILTTFLGFHTKIDDYLAVVPTCIPMAMSVLGIKGKHELKDQIILAILSHSLSQGITNGLKYTIAYPRPDGVGMESFPSGHTTFAFTGAALMAKEYGEQSIWYSVAAYSLATGVGSLRLLNNRHWLADVLVGAGVGLASTEIVYRSYPWLKRKIFKNKNWVALPTYSYGVGGLSLAAVF